MEFKLKSVQGSMTLPTGEEVEIYLTQDSIVGTVQEDGSDNSVDVVLDLSTKKFVVTVKGWTDLSVVQPIMDNIKPCLLALKVDISA